MAPVKHEVVEELLVLMLMWMSLGNLGLCEQARGLKKPLPKREGAWT